MFPQHLGRVITKRSHAQTGRLASRVALALVTVVALVAASGCGSSSKPAYCKDRTNLENSVKDLPSTASSSGLSGLQSQLTTIQSDATTAVDAAKSDFPSETTALKSSVDTLSSAVKALPSSPSAAQIAAVALDAKNVVTSVNAFTSATKSKCN